MSSLLDLEILNPTEIPEWDSILLRNNDHSFFHCSAWAKVLESTYHYRPIYFVLFESEKLALLVPFMDIASLLTGKRGISLPFSDQCPPLSLNKGLLREAVAKIIDYGQKANWRYIEWRDAQYFDDNAPPSDTYITHDLCLKGTDQELFSHFKDGNKSNIKKAIRERVSIDIGQSLDSVKEFYRLACLTRKRHGLPPQPYIFFKNIFDYVLSKGLGIIVSASDSGKIYASSIFFHFGTSALYKFSASDIEYQRLRANNLIVWEAIKWYKARGFESLSLGRTEPENGGLLHFKRSWGAVESIQRYYRYDLKKKDFHRKQPRSSFYTKIFAHTPIAILRLIGKFLYKHIG